MTNEAIQTVIRTAADGSVGWTQVALAFIGVLGTAITVLGAVLMAKVNVVHGLVNGQKSALDEKVKRLDELVIRLEKANATLEADKISSATASEVKAATLAAKGKPNEH